MPPALYIPSTKTLPALYSTDEYVEKTQFVYHLNTDRMLMVGNPYMPVADADKGGEAVPMVSANQYRCFRFRLPDPNGEFPLPASDLFNPEVERLVWQVIAVEVCRGQPVGVGISCAPVFNKSKDVENPNRMIFDDPGLDTDNRVNAGFDPKQNQMIIVGCAPAVGQHWSAAEPCAEDTLDTRCPPIELVNTPIEDGDMSDIGFGAMDFASLGINRSDVPLELYGATSKYPDWIKMHSEPKGDSCFFLVRREQMYARRLWQHSGKPGEAIPRGTYPGDNSYVSNNLSYLATPSGSVVTSDTSLFNRPYWLSQSQGSNNGICWNENLFVTCLDNTRNIIMNISTKARDAEQGDFDSVYRQRNYEAYVRHVEEYELRFLLRLCKVRLTPTVLSHLYQTNPLVLKAWGISEAPQTITSVEDKYRFIESQATRCPLPRPPDAPTVEDPYAGLSYWTVDCKDRLAIDIGRYPLGRKFLALPGTRTTTRTGSRATGATKRSSSAVADTSRVTRSKRRRV